MFSGVEVEVDIVSLVHDFGCPSGLETRPQFRSRDLTRFLKCERRTIGFVPQLLKSFEGLETEMLE